MQHEKILNDSSADLEQELKRLAENQRLEELEAEKFRLKDALSDLFDKIQDQIMANSKLENEIKELENSAYDNETLPDANT